MNNEILKFECVPEGLYQYEVPNGYRKNLREEVKTHDTSDSRSIVDNGISNLISTVAENRKGYML